MTPKQPTAADLVWGGDKFVPKRINPKEAEPWVKYVWAKFIDHKPVLFQPKENISLQEAVLHLKACINSDTVSKERALLAAAWLCSQWFEAAEILA